MLTLKPLVLERQRWAFSETELKNARACRADDELIAAVPEASLGVIVYRNGVVTNRWEDGTAGVPDVVKDWVQSEEELYHPEVRESTSVWRGVVVRDGAFLQFYDDFFDA